MSLLAAASSPPAPDEASPSAGAPPAVGTVGVPRRVLVVDDDVLGARALARLLRDDGYEVEVVTDGAAGVARLSAEPLPDVVVTEVTLPHASGLALARYARAQRPGMVIVFATSAPDRARDASLSPGPQVVAKPVDYASLRDALPAPIR